MNQLTFSVFVTMITVFILSQTAHTRLMSYGTDKDHSNLYKHGALVTQKIDAFSRNICSGTIISDQHVLTAAHCVVKKGSKSQEIVDIRRYLIEVTVGIEKVSDPRLQTVRAVETIFLPTVFTYEEDTRNAYGDIAVLKLNRKLGLDTNPRIQALKLPHDIKSSEAQEDEYSEWLLTFTGFGDIDGKLIFNNSQGKVAIASKPADYLYYSEAQVIPHRKCDYEYSTYKLCIELLNFFRDATICPGDSGGALFDKYSKEIIGVVSTGSSICEFKEYSHVTRVIAFKDIIEEAVNNDREIPFKSRRISFVNDPYYRIKVSSDERYHKKFNSDVNIDQYQPPEQEEPLHGDQGKRSMYAR